MNTVIHEIEPVWNSESRILILGTMPSPASRMAGFFYMHPQNRFWKVVPEVFGEKLRHSNTEEGAVQERIDFLLRNHIALWDVLSSCKINGASDSSIKNAVPNDFTEILTVSKIKRIFCTGKTAFNLWKKMCAEKYEAKFKLQTECLPSTSPANAAWSITHLVEAYGIIRE